MRNRIFTVFIGLALAGLLLAGNPGSAGTNDAAWSSVDGDGLTGLNMNTGKYARLPILITCNGALYAIWQEQDDHIRVKRYDGGGAWTFVDGGGTYGLNMDPTRAGGRNPAAAIYNNQLYVAWNEWYNSSGLTCVFIKRYNGDGTWTDVSSPWEWWHDNPIGSNTNWGYYPGSPNQLQYLPNCAPGYQPTLCAFDGYLYAAWIESYNGDDRVHVRRYDGSTWTFVDGGFPEGYHYTWMPKPPHEYEGLNYNPLENATAPRLAVYNNQLYLTWFENYNNGEIDRQQIRVRRYDGQIGGVETWTFVDGGGNTGLNYDPTKYTMQDPQPQPPAMAEYNGELYLAWLERTYNDPTWGYVDQIRLKKYDGSTWTFMDGGGAAGLNRNPSLYAGSPELFAANNELYLGWCEEHDDLPPVGTYTPPDYERQIRIKKFNGQSWTYIAGEDMQGLNHNYLESAYDPAFAVLDGELFVAWFEHLGEEAWGGIDQIRIKKTPLPAVVTSVGVPADGTYSAGQNLDFTVNLNKAVTVDTAGGTPYLSLTLGTGGAVQAAYQSDLSTSSTLVFRYTVQSGHLDADGITLGRYITLNGATIRDNANNLNAVPVLAGAGDTAGILVDGVAPTKISTSPLDDAIDVGANQSLIVYFSENIAKGTDNVEIRRTDNDSLVESIDVAGARVTVSADSATIDPSVTFADSTGYYVLIPATAFLDAAGNCYAGISAKTAWSFSTPDSVAPSGYMVSIDQPYINNNNKTALSFTFAGAEVSTTYNYTLTCDGGGTPVTGSGTISSATQQVTGITTMGLNEGTITLSVTLTDASGNTGAAATDTVLKDTLLPSGYAVAISQAYISSANETDLAFTFTGAETGASYSYSITSSGGGADVIGGGTAGSSSGMVSGIDVSALNDGTLTISLTMTDAAGNPGLPVTDTVAKDTVGPGVTISTTADNPTPLVPIPVAITFSKAVTGFAISDIAVTNGTARNLGGSGTSYSAEITPNTQGTVTIQIAAGAAQDAWGNASAAATPLSLTFTPQPRQVTNLGITQDAAGAVHLTWTNPGGDWDKTRVVRKSGGYPSGPADGTLVYLGAADEASDPDLPAGTYYYAVYGSYYGAYATPAMASITTAVGNKIRQTFQPGDGGASTLQTAQSWRGTSYTAWNGAELPLGCGPSGAQSGIWLQYVDLIGSQTGQVPMDARIIGARLVLRIKRYESTARLNVPYTLKIYRVPEAAGLGAPYFGATDGIRTGLDWAYRDDRLGMNRPWAAGATNIAAALGSAELLDTLEFIPAVCSAEGCDELSLDVTKALKAWEGDGETAQANQGFFLVIEGGNPGDVVVFDNAAATAGRPLLEVVYVTDPGADLTGLTSTVANLAAVPGAGQIALTWTNPTSDPDFTGVKIVRRAGRTPFNAYDGDLIYDGAATSYTDTGLTDGTVYYYAAFAYDSNRNYGPKAWIRAIPGTPTAPVLTAVEGADRIDLSWTAPDGATSYALYRDDGTEVRRIELENVTSHIDLNVENKTYTYRVAGVNAAGEGQMSAPKTASTSIVDTALSAPTGLSASTVTNTSATLAWDDYYPNETGFAVERSDGGSPWHQVGTTGFNVASFADTGLTPATAYKYRVKVIRGGQSSDWCAPIDVITAATPQTPTNLTWTVISAGRVNLSWTDTPNDDGYRIEVCDASGNPLAGWIPIDLWPDVTSYSVTGLTPGVGYIFKVYAVNGAGDSAAAVTEIVTTGSDPKDDLI